MSASTPSTAPDPGTTATLVAVGLIQRSDGCVLLAERPAHLAHGGCWEFPGGKVEAGESLFQALARELREELGIEVRSARPWRSIPWVYPKGRVRLEVWRVETWSGEAVGLEGQRLAWEPIDRLPHLAFPAANRHIVNALRLPDRLLVTPEPPPGQDPLAQRAWLARLGASLAAGIPMLQYRAKALLAERPAEWRSLGREVVALAHAHDALVLANAPADEAQAIGADGVHLTSQALMALEARPSARLPWWSASCHDAAQIERAEALALDFLVLGPVEATASHPGTSPLGWPMARRLVEGTALPVYLVGGLGPEHLPAAAEVGAQGIAAIRALW